MSWSFFNKLKSPYPSKLNFGWKCPGGSGEVDENMKILQRNRRRQQQRQKTCFDQKIPLDNNTLIFTKQMVSTWSTVLPRYKKSAEYPFCTSFVISLCRFGIKNIPIPTSLKCKKRKLFIGVLIVEKIYLYRNNKQVRKMYFHFTYYRKITYYWGCFIHIKINTFDVHVNEKSRYTRIFYVFNEVYEGKM